MAEKKFMVDLNLNGNKIKNLANPTDPNDAATKAYVDSVAGGGGSSNFVFANINIPDNAWTDNGDGTYSYEVDLAANGFGASYPAVQLVKRATSSSGSGYAAGNVYYEPIVDAQIEYKVDDSAGTFGVRAVKVTIGIAPTSDMMLIIIGSK